MDDTKYLDSCIDYLKKMLGDPHNELESDQCRALTEELRKLKRLKLKPTISRDDLYRIVSEVAVTVSEIM